MLRRCHGPRPAISCMRNARTSGSTVNSTTALPASECVFLAPVDGNRDEPTAAAQQAHVNGRDLGRKQIEQIMCALREASQKLDSPIWRIKRVARPSSNGTKSTLPRRAEDQGRRKACNTSGESPMPTRPCSGARMTRRASSNAWLGTRVTSPIDRLTQHKGPTRHSTPATDRNARRSKEEDQTCAKAAQ